jgi:hypothetical protein
MPSAWPGTAGRPAGAADGAHARTSLEKDAGVSLDDIHRRADAYANAAEAVA